MKTILSAIVAAGIFASAAHAAGFDSFNNPEQALPRSSGYEQALPNAGNDDHRQALPRGEQDTFTDPSLPLPLTDATFPDTTIATP